MTTQEKILAILGAIDEGKTSANKLEPTRRGATVVKLRAGKPVKDATVDKLYARLLEVTGDVAEVKAEIEVEQPKEGILEKEVTRNIESEAREVIEQKSIPVENEETKAMLEALAQRVTVLEAENREMRERLAAIERTSIAPVHEATKSITESIPDDGIRNVLGFCLAQSSKGFWYAVKRINGTQYSVYVGRNKRQAESKIRAWSERKGMFEVLPEVNEAR